VLVAATAADAIANLQELGRGLPDKQASADVALQEASQALAQFSRQMFKLQQDQLELKRLRDEDQLEIKQLKRQREEDQRERAARKAAKLQAAKLQAAKLQPEHGTFEWIKKHWVRRWCAGQLALTLT